MLNPMVILYLQQVTGLSRCSRGSHYAHLDMCHDIIVYFAKFQIWHVPRHENQKANMLVQ
jgi:hypothetical protein